MPHGGFDDWDKEGEWAFDKNAIETFYKEIKKILDDRVEFHEIVQNINEPQFTDLALNIFDRWVKEGFINP